jgi:hypothetical protein
MNQKDIWEKYINAQSKILEYKSRPIGIDTSKSILPNGLKLQLSIDQEIFKQIFKREVEHIFKIKNYDFESGYIQTSLEDASKITSEQLNKLKELAENCYIDFNENPVIEGTIKGQENISKEALKNIIGEEPLNSPHFKNSGLIFLTIDKWNKATQIQGIKFNKKIGSVFSLKPSISFLISTYYRNIEISQKGNIITLEGELHQNVYDVFEKYFGLAKRRNELIFTFENKNILKQRIDV